MADRASALQGIRVGVQATNVAVPTNRDLASIGLTPSIKMDIATMRPQGRLFTRVASMIKEWSSLKIQSDALTYDEVNYLFATMFGPPTITRLIPSTGLAYAYDYAMAAKSVAGLKRLTVEHGDDIKTSKMANCVGTDLGLSFDLKNGITADGTLMGQRYDYDVVATANPTTLPVVPVVASDFAYWLADDPADFDTMDINDALDRVVAANLKIGNRQGPIWRQKRAQSWADTVALVPSAELELTMGADDEGMAILPSARLGETKYLRAEALGPQIEDDGGDPIHYMLRLDMSLKVTKELGEMADEDGLFGLKWGFSIAESFPANVSYTLKARVICTSPTL